MIVILLLAALHPQPSKAQGMTPEWTIQSLALLSSIANSTENISLAAENITGIAQNTSAHLEVVTQVFATYFPEISNSLGNATGPLNQIAQNLVMHFPNLASNFESINTVALFAKSVLQVVLDNDLVPAITESSLVFNSFVDEHGDDIASAITHVADLITDQGPGAVSDFHKASAAVVIFGQVAQVFANHPYLVSGCVAGSLGIGIGVGIGVGYLGTKACCLGAFKGAKYCYQHLHPVEWTQQFIRYMRQDSDSETL